MATGACTPMTHTLGRPGSTATVLDNPAQPATVSLAYDANTGRVSQQTWPTGYLTNYQYTASGYLKKVMFGGSMAIRSHPTCPTAKPSSNATFGFGARRVFALGLMIVTSDTTMSAALILSMMEFGMLGESVLPRVSDGSRRGETPQVARCAARTVRTGIAGEAQTRLLRQRMCGIAVRK